MTDTVRSLLKSADQLLTFDHDPVDGSFQVCPPALDVHLAGEFVHRALALLDADKERYFDLNSEHGTDEVFALVYDPEVSP